MKVAFAIIVLFFLYSCSNQKKVFWCGDHQCLNKKEKEIYFKKTMTVEIKVVNQRDKKSNSRIENKILEEDKKKRNKKDKKISQNIILEEKKLIKENKIKDEQARLDYEKKKEEEDMVKQIILEEKELKNKEQEKMAKKVIMDDKKETRLTKNENDISFEKTGKNLLDFDSLVRNITDKNLNKPFPNINDIPK